MTKPETLKHGSHGPDMEELTKVILTLSSDDIVYQAEDRGVHLTVKQVSDLFERFEPSDPLMESFWLIIDCMLDNLDYFSPPPKEESK